MSVIQNDPSSGESDSLRPAASDDEEEQSVWQKELWFEKLLPYFDQVEKEADQHLASIKAGLGHSVLLRDMRPALLHWIVELDKYIYLHSRRFTKNDHVLFIKIFYSLIQMPDLEFRMVKTLAHIMGTLLAKRELLSRDDLSLDWKPLYDLYWFICYKSVEEDGLMLLPDQMKASMETLISHCRTYFPIEATKEILETVRPYMSPWDAVFMRSVNICYLFLPTCLTLEEHRQFGAALWFDEFWFWFHTIQNSPPWAGQVLHLFARLVVDCPAFVEWSPYYDEIFTRILRNFELQLGSGTLRVPIGNGSPLPLETLAVLVSGLLGGPENKAQSHVSRLFRSVDSYFHPSNYGRWTEKLLTFLLKLSQAVCQRLHRERYRKPDWLPHAPPELLLTDVQIEEFVNSVLPCALQAIFTKVKQEIAPAVIRYLALLAPKIVIPAVLDRVYPSLETLTEPHRLLQSLNCLVHSLLSLVRDKGIEKEVTKEIDQLNKKRRRRTDEDNTTQSRLTGMRCHVFPLLNAILPGLDSNDIAKATVTFQAIGLLCALVPLVDCSEAVHVRTDLTEEEKELCSATAQAEDFVNRLLDRIFGLIETTSHGQPVQATSDLRSGKENQQSRASFEEQLLKHGIYSIFHTVARNSSTPIYEVIVDRLYHFIESNIFVSRIVADTVAEMIYCVVRTNPEKSLPRFICFLLGKLRENITEETYKEEEIDDSLLWYLTLCSQLVRTGGNHLVKCKDDLLEMLRLIYPIQCRQAYEVSVVVFEHLLIALCSIYGDVHGANRDKLNLPFDQYFPIRHWAEMCDRKTVTLQWHVPSEPELNFAEQIMQEFLRSDLDRLNKPESMTKEEIAKSLAYIKACIGGMSSVLPVVTGPVIPLANSLVDMVPFSYVIGPSNVRQLSWEDGSNVRESVFTTLHSLSSYLLEHKESDTKSLGAICKLFGHLLFYRGLDKSKFDQQHKAYTMSKKIVGDMVRGNKANIQAIVQEMCILHHHKRLLGRSGYYFTSTHVAVIQDLVKLGTSAYADVRKDAQTVLSLCFTSFPYCYQFVLDEILAFLKPHPDVSHEQFKGSLYILLNGKRQCVCVRHTWKTLSRVWPALVTAQHSEKPSVIALLELAQDTIIDNLESFSIKLEMSGSCFDLSKKLWDVETNGPIRPCLSLPTDNMVSTAIKDEKQRNEENESLYYKLIDELVTLSTNSDLHWRHEDLAQSLLSLLIRYDQTFPEQAVRQFVRLLTHDSLKSRRMAVAFLGAWLRMSRPKAKKLSSTKLTGTYSDHQKWPIRWGLRKDLEPVMYRSELLPKNQTEWDETCFVDKTHWGIYGWPKELLVYAPSNEQLDANRSYEQLSDSEKAVVDAFTDKEFLDKFVVLNSLEEKKGEDMFNPMTYGLFKGVFRNFSDLCLESMKPFVEKLVESEKEGEQRLAAEIIAGLLQGSRLWTYDKLVSLWNWIRPVLTKALENITNESAKNWGSAVATIMDSRDPRRMHWLFDLLFDLCRRKPESSFHSSMRLFLLQGALNQVEWRVLELWHDLFDLIRSNLCQPFQNLRARLGSCITTIVWFDVPGITVEFSDPKLHPPRIEDVLNELVPQLEILTAEIYKTPHSEENNANGVANKDSENNINSAERKEAILLLKTLLCFFSSHFVNGYVTLPKSILQFLPLLCYFENETTDDELKRDAHFQLRQGMARALIYSENAQSVLDIGKQIAEKSQWWKSKVSLLQFLQVAIFSNYFYYMTCSHVKEVSYILEKLLQDQRLEVREAAAETLTGFVMCGYIRPDNTLINHFRSWSQQHDLVIRHAGVLALIALVRAFPYTVPQFVPNVLMAICPHASGPQPIQATVKKGLAEFKRTHQDSWHEHKIVFTDDQLAVLTDLLVSPSYYV